MLHLTEQHKIEYLNAIKKYNLLEKKLKFKETILFKFNFKIILNFN